MAHIFFPDEQRLTAKGYGSLVCVPVLFDSSHRYLRAHNRYLRERALLEWPPHKDPNYARLHGRRVTFPAPLSLKKYADNLVNWVEWCEEHSTDWRHADYVKDVLRYRDDQITGKWSSDGLPLSVSFAEHRVDTVVDFLSWAFARTLRGAFHVPREVARRKVRSNTATSRTYAEFKRRAGRRRSAPINLRLPSLEQLEQWHVKVLARRGSTKALFCRVIMALALRLMEAESLPASILPDDPTDWNIIGDHVYVTVHHTKYKKPRLIAVPTELAEEIDRYKRGRRIRALAKWRTKHPGQASPDNLFLGEYDGTPISGVTIYEAWKIGAPYKEWSPHLARHTWACYTLLQKLSDESLRLWPCSSAVPHTWISSFAETLIDTHIRPQLGHVSKDTTLIYLRWIVAQFALPAATLRWQGFLTASTDAGP